MKKNRLTSQPPDHIYEFTLFPSIDCARKNRELRRECKINDLYQDKTGKDVENYDSH